MRRVNTCIAQHDLTLPGQLPDTPEETEAVARAVAGVGRRGGGRACRSGRGGRPQGRHGILREARLLATESHACARRRRLKTVGAGRRAPSRADSESRSTLRADSGRAHRRADPEEIDELPPEIVVEPEPIAAVDEEAASARSKRSTRALTDDFMSMPPSFGASDESSSDDHAFPPLDGLAESALERGSGGAGGGSRSRKR